jgi:enhancing lycopene biosynthesis protein 2
MNERVGVVLSGCGYLDGSEIHESVLALLALDRAGCEVHCFAPDVAQSAVVNHLTGKESPETRNVLVESARIARGKVRPLKEARAADLDALVLPGGFGAAKNLSDFATKGAEATVNPDLQRLLRDLHAAKKPIGAICIAPGTVARALGAHHPTLTIGHDAATARAIEACGATHEACAVDDVVVDEANRIVSTPAYMLGPSIRHVAEGVERCVSKVLDLVHEAATV